MEKLLLVAEKPSLMRELKQAYTNHKKDIPYNIDFTVLAGHICMYSSPKEYDEWNKKWEAIELPMIPSSWKIKIIEDKTRLYRDIEELIKRNGYDGYICATDADREGNLIYYLLESKMKLIKCKTYRLWVHDLTDGAIFESFRSMVDFHNDEKQKNFTYAAILRSRMDWLIGMNISVAATLQFGKTMHVGRVESPVMKLVYDNSMAIEHFVPKTTYGVEAVYKEGFSGVLCDENDVISFDTEKEAHEVISRLSDSATVTDIKKNKVTTYAPRLYKLSDLQVEANKAYGYSASSTLETVQSLYERHKIVSYPRCDCRSISSAQADNFRVLIAAATVNPSLAEYADLPDVALKSVAGNKKYVNDEDVNQNSHTALMPTGKKPDLSALNEAERNIFEMICKRFIAVFLPPLVEDKTTVITENNGYLFKTNGKTVKERGFTVLYNKQLEDKALPPLKKGMTVHVESLGLQERTSTPPKRLTEGTLIEEMEKIGKYITDEKLRAIMKEAKGIGTPATRSGIITKLIKNGYILTEKSGKVITLSISDIGKKYIECLKNIDIIKPELTAIWENKLQNVAHGNMFSGDFSNEMKGYIYDTVRQIRGEPRVARVYTGNGASHAVAACPRCAKPICESARSYFCTGYREGCRFSIWKDNRECAAVGITIDAELVRELIEKGTALRSAGPESPSGRTGMLRIILEPGKAGYPRLTVEAASDGENSKDAAKAD